VVKLLDPPSVALDNPDREAMLPLAVRAAHIMADADDNDVALAGWKAEKVDERRFQTMRVMTVRVKDETWLLVFGTDEWRDWFVHNFRFLPVNDRGKPLTPLQLAKVAAQHLEKGWLSAPGENGHYWHRGFKDGWDLISAYTAKQKPDLIVGHSLGGGVAQIGCVERDCRGLGYGCPNVNFILGPAISDKIVNYCRTDDPVATLPPPYWGYHHVGYVQWLEPAVKRPDVRHYMRTSYVPIMEELAWAEQPSIMLNLTKQGLALRPDGFG
jgi:GNAT superfamily N-acetyltransferase